MKQIVKYRILTIAGKLTMEVRLTVNDSAAYISMRDGVKYVNVNMTPFIGISLTKPAEIDESGNRIRAPWNPNDHLGLTKYNLPILYEELHGIQQDMKQANLYTYHGKRLEINENLAEKVRRVFMIGNITVELSAVVIVQLDETRVEGVKMKFNKEPHSVLLTVNELNSLVFNIAHMDIDAITLAMYQAFIDKPANSITSNTVNVDFPLPPPMDVDIVPKERG